MALGLSQPKPWPHENVWRPLTLRQRLLVAPAREANKKGLARYLEGWAEANPAKILDAVTPNYHLRDPLVGAFTKRSLPQYFDILQARCARGGTTMRQDCAFFLHGPLDEPLSGVLQFWREAPRIGLTGITRIEFTAAGVMAESVVYDLNLASDLLRDAAYGQGRPGQT
jgi:hypothetical protein